MAVSWKFFPWAVDLLFYYNYQVAVKISRTKVIFNWNYCVNFSLKQTNYFVALEAFSLIFSMLWNLSKVTAFWEKNQQPKPKPITDLFLSNWCFLTGKIAWRNSQVASLQAYQFRLVHIREPLKKVSFHDSVVIQVLFKAWSKTYCCQPLSAFSERHTQNNQSCWQLSVASCGVSVELMEFSQFSRCWAWSILKVEALARGHACTSVMRSWTAAASHH